MAFRDEIQGWMKSMGQYKTGSSAERQAYLELWSGTALKVNLPQRLAQAENPDPINHSVVD